MFSVKQVTRRAFSSDQSRNLVAKLKALPYELGALEPVISGQTMEFHYGKHHRTYVNNLNSLSVQSAEALANGDIKRYIELCHLVKFNGGGHLNHELFWETLAPTNAGGGAIPDAGSDLRTMIENEWGTIEEFQNYFNTQSATLQGSGWGWLAYNKGSGLLEYRQTRNQDTLADISTGLVPLIGVDVWEHAYYLDYKNQRPTYLKEMWNIMNWPKIEERLAAAKAE